MRPPASAVGEHLSWLPLNGRLSPEAPPGAAIFDLALYVTGNGAMFRLSGMRVAIIGASGTGSVMIELLVRAGVGEIVLFEFDRAGLTNVNRVLHLRLRDAKGRVPKADRLAAAMRETGLPTRIRVVPGGDIRDDDVAAGGSCV